MSSGELPGGASSLPPADAGNDPVTHSGPASLRWTGPIFVLLAVLFVWRIPTFLSAPAQYSPAIGKPAPQIDLVILNDQPRLVRVQTYPPDSVAVLHFWGTWCGPCRMEFPELVEMIERYQTTPTFLFLPVSCEADSRETFGGILAKTSRYCISEGIDTASYVDPRGVTRRSVAQRLERNSMAYPTTVVIDADGQIAGVWEGYTPRSVKQIEWLLSDLLSKAPDSQASL